MIYCSHTGNADKKTKKKNASCQWPQCLYSCRVGVAHRRVREAGTYAMSRGYMKFAIRFGEKGSRNIRPASQFHLQPATNFVVGSVRTKYLMRKV